MSLSFADLVGGAIPLPTKEVYIDALGDAIEIQPITLQRRKSIQDKHGDKWLDAYVAESISQEEGISMERAQEILEQARANMHEAAWDEISEAILETQFGKQRVVEAGNASRTQD